MKSDLKFFKKSKVIPVDRFFKSVLYDNKHGYYTSKLPFGKRILVEYVLYCIENDKLIEGPLNPEFCLTGQRIVDTAYQSSFAGKTLDLINA